MTRRKLTLPLLSREEREKYGRIGAFVQQSRHDPNEYTVPAMVAFRQRFYDSTTPASPTPNASAEPRRS
jgi:phage-related protein